MNILKLSNETWGVFNSARVYLAKDASITHPSWNNMLQLLGLLFIFVIVLIAAWFVSKYIGGKAMTGYGNKNINIIENFRLDSNKAIQIVRIADKYYAIGVGKEEINVLAEVDEDKIILSNNNNSMNFKDIFKSAKNTFSKNKSDIVDSNVNNDDVTTDQYEDNDN